MTEPREPTPSLSLAESAFVEFLAGQDSDRPVEFDAFAARHPTLLPELRRLYDEWLNVARVLRRGREEPTPRAEKAEGEAVEELRLDSDGEALKLEFAGEIVRRLARTRTSDDRYEARGELARGGMGVVHRVWDPQLRRQLAMKVILARREAASPEERAHSMHRALVRFLEEAQVTSQLDHPGIVPVHDLGIDNQGRVYFTMRLVRGRDFRRILELLQRTDEREREGWTLARALGVLLKVCEAVAYAHSKGVIHRDLKPANVMVGRFGEVYVMDWGLARVLGRKDPHDLRIVHADSASASHVDTDVRRFAGQTPGSPLLTMDGRVVGTPSYMSPEQATGRIVEIGPRSDVYAIGAMLYQLLTRQMPYVPPRAEISPANIYSMLLAGPPPPVKQLAPDAPDELAAICAKAMTREPQVRYASPLDLAHDVEAFLDRRPVRALEPTFRYVARLFLERNRTLSTTVAAALVVLAAVIGFAWSRNLEKQRVNERLLDLRSAQMLVGSIEELFPAEPKQVPAMDAWLDDTDAVLARAATYRRELADARFASNHGIVSELEPAVLAMDRLEHVLRPRLASWREKAAALDHVSLEIAESEWRSAIAEIARLPAYQGLTRPFGKQLGLVPLRRDAKSGLWEFWHVLSGDRPESDDSTPSGYRVTPTMGIVLVLVPGGTVTVGSPVDEAGRDPPNEDENEVHLDPFLLGKFEVTQSQWNRAMAEDAPPSLYGPGAAILGFGFEPGDPRADAAVHPVESVNWSQCARFTRRIGLRLPREDEWECACRGGTRTAFWWQGASNSASPEGFENVGDVSCTKATALGTFPFDDGFAGHAPIGAFLPNPFGLHDIAGNVSEWCDDWYASSSPPDDVPRRRIVRGGDWRIPVDYLRSAARQWDNPQGVNQMRGLRVARSLDAVQ